MAADDVENGGAAPPFVAASDDRAASPKPASQAVMVETQGGDGDRAAAIATLNDAFRQTFACGRVLMTRGVAALPDAERQTLIAKVRAPLTFTPGNDPYREHDFGVVDQDGVLFFWKIDGYDTDYVNASPDSADPDVTGRVLTIMRADEY